MKSNPLIFPLPDIPLDNSTKISCSGYCEKCGSSHFLVEGKAESVARHLLKKIEHHGRIDLPDACSSITPDFSTDYLYTAARGQMFGVLTFIDQDGNEGYIRAFSGQYNSIWNIRGWVPPLLDQDKFQELTFSEEKEIKRLSRIISEISPDHPDLPGLKTKRRNMSAQLMSAIHELFILHNFKGEEKKLPKAALQGRGIPTGTGECCAPKLLDFAAQNNLHPTGLTEFFIGRSNRSGSRIHGQTYPSCSEKCSLILGFMLCGI